MSWKPEDLQEFRRIAPVVFDHFGLTVEERTFVTSYMHQDLHLLECYRAIYNSLRCQHLLH